MCIWGINLNLNNTWKLLYAITFEFFDNFVWRIIAVVWSWCAVVGLLEQCSVVPRLNLSRSPNDVHNVGHVENDECNPEDDSPFFHRSIWCKQADKKGSVVEQSNTKLSDFKNWWFLPNNACDCTNSICCCHQRSSIIWWQIQRIDFHALGIFFKLWMKFWENYWQLTWIECSHGSHGNGE